VTNFDGYVKPSVEMSSRGLYAYDSYTEGYKERPYFRVSLPRRELNFAALPQNHREILKFLRMTEISFKEDFLINEEIVAKL
jgi:hypothetical protein